MALELVKSRRDPWPAGVPLPPVCGIDELARIFNRSTDHISRMVAAGKFSWCALPPMPGDRRRPRFSGVKLQRWLDGEQTDALATRRFFGKARA